VNCGAKAFEFIKELERCSSLKLGESLFVFNLAGRFIPEKLIIYTRSFNATKSKRVQSIQRGVSGHAIATALTSELTLRTALLFVSGEAVLSDKTCILVLIFAFSLSYNSCNFE
jgi:hypothetical protein